MIIYSQLFVPTVSAYLKFDVYKFNQPWVVQYFSMYLLKKSLLLRGPVQFFVLSARFLVSQAGS